MAAKIEKWKTLKAQEQQLADFLDLSKRASALGAVVTLEKAYIEYNHNPPVAWQSDIIHLVAKSINRNLLKILEMAVDEAHQQTITAKHEAQAEAEKLLQEIQGE